MYIVVIDCFLSYQISVRSNIICDIYKFNADHGPTNHANKI